MTSRELTDHFYKLLFKGAKISGEFIFPANTSEDWMDTDFKENEVENVVFENINMSVGGVENSKLNNCIFRNCNLEIFNIKDSSLVNVSFEQSFLGISLRNCDLDKVNLIYNKPLGTAKDLREFKNLSKNTVIEDSKEKDFENILFEQVEAEGLVLENCQFRKVYFVSCYLKNITFKNCVFHDCTVLNSQMNIKFVNSRVEQNLRFQSIK